MTDKPTTVMATETTDQSFAPAVNPIPFEVAPEDVPTMNPSIPESAFAALELETNVTKRVKTIVMEHFGVNSVRCKDELVNDYGLDSLDYVDLIMAVEDEFNVKVPDETLSPEKYVSIQDVIDGVMTLVKK